MINRNTSYLLILCLAFLASSLDAASWWQRTRERGRKASQHASQKYSELSGPARFALIAGAAGLLIAALRYGRPDLYNKYADHFSSLSKSLWNDIRKRASLIFKTLSQTQEEKIIETNIKEAAKRGREVFENLRDYLLQDPNEHTKRMAQRILNKTAEDFGY